MKETNESSEKPKVDKVITNNVTVSKKKHNRFSDIFVAEDIQSVGDYIFTDVLVPSIKKAFYDIITNGLDMFLYGSDGRHSNSTTPASRVSYTKYYDRNRRDARSDNSIPVRKASSRYDYNEIVFETRGEAEEVLLRMDELINMYNIVSVADFYDLVGVTGDYTDNKYGWANLASASVIPTRNGYVIKLPKALPID